MTVVPQWAVPSCPRLSFHDAFPLRQDAAGRGRRLAVLKSKGRKVEGRKRKKVRVGSQITDCWPESEEQASRSWKRNLCGGAERNA